MGGILPLDKTGRVGKTPSCLQQRSRAHIGQQNSEERREGCRKDPEGPPIPPSKRSVFLWWVLASALGGAAREATSILEFFGLFFLFGPLFGAAQALVLGHYLKNLRGEVSSVRLSAAPWTFTTNPALAFSTVLAGNALRVELALA